MPRSPLQPDVSSHYLQNPAQPQRSMLKLQNWLQLGTSSDTQGTRLRFAAMLLRRAIIINTSTTKTTPAITRIVVGSIEALSLNGCGAGIAPVIAAHFGFNS